MFGGCWVLDVFLLCILCRFDGLEYFFKWILVGVFFYFF